MEVGSSGVMRNLFLSSHSDAFTPWSRYRALHYISSSEAMMRERIAIMRRKRYVLFDDVVRQYPLNGMQIPSVKALQHRREINKKTRSAEKRLRKTLKSVKKVIGSFPS
jgi:hypothetical protein